MTLAFNTTIELLTELHGQPLLPAHEAGLERIRVLLRLLNNPQTTFRAVHVAGSSGKGSTTAMIESILRAAGFVTGLFRSPHLFSYTERVAVLNKEISQDEWVRWFETLWPLVENMRNGTVPDYALGRPSHGEVLFALMALHFRHSGVEWAAIETGLGGRLDATNVLDSEVAAITNISLEHTRILGNTIPAIAAEKAAIIKCGSAAVTAVSDDAALAVIERRATEVGAPLLRVGYEVEVQALNATASKQTCRLVHGDTQVEAVLPFGGNFQLLNAATAFGAAEALHSHDIALKPSAIRRGLENVRIPGRFEVLQEQPTIVLDGAHNPAAAAALAETLDQIFPGRRIVLLFAAMADKDTSLMLKHLARRSALVVTTRVPNAPRAATPQALASQGSIYGVPALAMEPVEVALAAAMNDLGQDDVLLVAGSLYLVGWARQTLGEIGEFVAPSHAP